MVIRLMDFSISFHTNIYFVTSLLPRGEEQPYPLLAGHMDIWHWVEAEGVAHCGCDPYEEGCIKIKVVLNLAE